MAGGYTHAAVIVDDDTVDGDQFIQKLMRGTEDAVEKDVDAPAAEADHPPAQDSPRPMVSEETPHIKIRNATYKSEGVIAVDIPGWGLLGGCRCGGGSVFVTPSMCG